MCVCVYVSPNLMSGTHRCVPLALMSNRTNCPSIIPLNSRKAFAIGTISLFAEFYELMS